MVHKLVNERCGIDWVEWNATGATASWTYELEGDYQLLKKNLFPSIQLFNRCKFDVQRAMHRNVFLWKPTRCTVSQIYLIKYSTCFGQIYCPSSGVYQHCIHAIGICHARIAWQIPIACIQYWDTPHDGQRTCPKHVEYFIKQIWEIVHLVGFHYKNQCLQSCTDSKLYNSKFQLHAPVYY
jgi:hypothetical protein